MVDRIAILIDLFQRSVKQSHRSCKTEAAQLVLRLALVLAPDFEACNLVVTIPDEEDFFLTLKVKFA